MNTDFKSKCSHLLDCCMALIVVSLAAAACGPTLSATPDVIAPTEGAASATIRPAMHPSPTVSSTSTPSWTPDSLSATDQVSTQLQAWLEGSPGCRLPCWAGIMPGTTTWEDAKSILSAGAVLGDAHNNIECTFGRCNVLEWRGRPGTIDERIHGFVYSQPDDLIHWIIVQIGQPGPIYRLDAVLAQYGPPESVFLSTSTFLQPSDDAVLRLTLAYPKYVFIVTYTWGARQVAGNIVSCAQDGISVGLDITPTTWAWTDDAIKSLVYGHTDVDAIVFRRLDEVTNMTIDEFYDAFRSIEGDECITTSIQYWP